MLASAMVNCQSTFTAAASNPVGDTKQGFGARWVVATQAKLEKEERKRQQRKAKPAGFDQLLELGEDLGVVLAEVAQHAGVVEELAQVADDQDQMQDVPAVRLLDQPELAAQRLQ